MEKLLPIGNNASGPVGRNRCHAVLLTAVSAVASQRSVSRRRATVATTPPDKQQQVQNASAIYIARSWVVCTHAARSLRSLSGHRPAVATERLRRSHRRASVPAKDAAAQAAAEAAPANRGVAAAVATCRQATRIRMVRRRRGGGDRCRQHAGQTYIPGSLGRSLAPARASCQLAKQWPLPLPLHHVHCPGK
eukprot:COSAG01_NODE_2032_length_8583_cov_14.706271_6_plen_192_part_00